jgi:hypothetical protein
VRALTIGEVLPGFNDDATERETFAAGSLGLADSGSARPSPALPNALKAWRNHYNQLPLHTAIGKVQLTSRLANLLGKYS